MAKAFDPALLEADRYSFSVDITTRFADMDSNGHINNVALAAAFEDARVRFDRENGLRSVGGQRVMIAAAYIDYLAQAYYPQPLRIVVGATSIGRSSWSIAELALQEGRAVALCRATLVNTDGTKASPFPDVLRANLQRVQVRVP